MSILNHSGYIRYLAAKKTLDDRSLNRQVWDHLMKAVRSRTNLNPLRVLEVGCGIGTMLERLIDWGLLTRASYTGIDLEKDFIREARRRFKSYATEKKVDFASQSENTMVFVTTDCDVRVDLESADLLDFLDLKQGKSYWDLLIAHAVLDLIDLPTVLPRLLSLLIPGGLFYFTLNFDGATILEPPVDRDLESLIQTLYHRTMDTRRSQGRPAGSSLTGRRLLSSLTALGAKLIAAGSSDWIVFPGLEGYPGDETYFLHEIMNTISRALHNHPELDPGRFENWLARRHRQIDLRELIYIAHQLDVMGYT